MPESQEVKKKGREEMNNLNRGQEKLPGLLMAVCEVT